MPAIEAAIVAVFVAVHVFAGRLRFLHVVPRSRWLSAAGGVAVAYVFIHVLPELEEARRSMGEGWPAVRWIEHHAYLVALAGLAVFYGLERMVRNDESSGAGTFWLHVGSFAIYNALVGYLLVHREEQDLRGLLFYGVAMAVHFVVNDYGLRQHHRGDYHRVGRWVLAAAVVAGWLLGFAIDVSDAAVGALFAFLAGGVVLNVLKEELPEERRSRFLPFALGAAGYAGLLLL